MNKGEPHDVLRRLYDEAAAAVDGRKLTFEARPLAPPSGPWVVVALGKVAGPMWEGLWQACLAEASPRRPDHVLIVTTPAAAGGILQPEDVDVEVLCGDHPEPSARSQIAAARVRHVVQQVPRDGHLTVLLSGGTSALVAEPLPGLSLGAKRRLTRELAHAGAPIAALNTVRKQLSRVKGGRLGGLAQARVELLVLADVLADDDTQLVSTVGSGPFSVDGGSYDEARAILAHHGVSVPTTTAAAWKAALAQVPPPSVLPRISAHIVGRPAQLGAAALAAATRAGHETGALPRDVELPVPALARAIVDRMADALAARAALPDAATPLATVLVGYGEPSLALPPGVQGRGGRASHLAWEVARLLDRWPDSPRNRVAFLAASTDDRDGSSTAHGALADGTTFARARERGLACEAYGRNFDTAAFFELLGDAVHGTGRSNVLDLHLALLW